MSAASITISHTREAGTVVEGTSRGDGSTPILKAAGFRWAPSIKAWIVQQSRDQAAKTWKINAAAEGLRAAGFEVDVSIDDTPRAFAEAEADRAERIEQRADRLADRADRAAAESTRRYQAARGILDVIPPGQPILVGHHSERRHRAALAKVDRNMRRSIDEDRKARELSQAAEVAGRYTDRREALGTTLRRIEKLEADERRIQRGMTPCKTSGKNAKAGANADGRTITCPLCYREVTFADGKVPEHGRHIGQASGERQLAELADELTYWHKVVADQQDQGVKVWGPADFTKGDFVRTRFGWSVVLRVNAKSLTVPSGYSWTDTRPYDDVHGRKPFEDAVTGLAGELVARGAYTRDNLIKAARGYRERDEDPAAAVDRLGIPRR